MPTTTEAAYRELLEKIAALLEVWEQAPDIPEAQQMARLSMKGVARRIREVLAETGK